MGYSSMYDVYEELCAKFPTASLGYDDNSDCVSVCSDNFTVSAYNQGVLMISDGVSQYQYNSGSYAETLKFLSDFTEGKVRFSQAQTGQGTELRVNGWCGEAGDRRQESGGKAALITGIAAMSIGALFTLCCIVFGLEDHDPENIVVADLFLGLFFSGLFNVMYSKKVKFVDIFGYFAGVCVTTIPSAIALQGWVDGDFPFIVAAIVTAVFFAIGHIVRNSFVKRIKQKGKEILLKCLPGPGDQNNY